MEYYFMQDGFQLF